jgi:hypothetical protein
MFSHQLCLEINWLGAVLFQVRLELSFGGLLIHDLLLLNLLGYFIQGFILLCCMEPCLKIESCVAWNHIQRLNF